MDIYKHNWKVVVEEDDVILKIICPHVATAASHSVFIDDEEILDKTGDIEEVLGKKSDLVNKTIIIVTQVVNADEDNDTIEVDYNINEVNNFKHTNPKSENPSPRIEITVEVL